MPTASYCGYASAGAVGEVYFDFTTRGNATLDFGNAYPGGHTDALLNDLELAQAPANQISKQVNFSFGIGDRLRIREISARLGINSLVITGLDVDTAYCGAGKVTDLTSAPTRAPTSPTRNPTKAPTKVPTAPTTAPTTTAAPTAAPSHGPTTAQPSTAPTTGPTSALPLNLKPPPAPGKPLASPVSGQEIIVQWESPMQRLSQIYHPFTKAYPERCVAWLDGWCQENSVHGLARYDIGWEGVAGGKAWRCYSFGALSDAKRYDVDPSTIPVNTRQSTVSTDRNIVPTAAPTARQSTGRCEDTGPCATAGLFRYSYSCATIRTSKCTGYDQNSCVAQRDCCTCGGGSASTQAPTLSQEARAAASIENAWNFENYNGNLTAQLAACMNASPDLPYYVRYPVTPIIVDGYSISMRSTSNTRWRVLIPNTANNQTKLDFKDGVPGNMYQFYVQAANSKGLSTASEPSSVVNTLSAPPAPNWIHIAHITKTTANISWHVPTFPGGPTSYTVSIAPNGELCNEIWCTQIVAASRTWFHVSNLRSGGAYVFAVAIRNSVGKLHTSDMPGLTN